MWGGRAPQDVGHGDLASLWAIQDGSSGVEDLFTQEGAKRLGVVMPYAIVVDVEVVEEGFDLVERRCGGVDSFLDGRQLAADALLLGGDEVERDRAAEDSFNQFLPLSSELGLLAGQLLMLTFGFLATGRRWLTPRQAG